MLSCTHVIFKQSLMPNPCWDSSLSMVFSFSYSIAFVIVMLKTGVAELDRT